MKLLIMSSLVFGIACGDDDTLPTFDGGTPDVGTADVPMLDVPMVDAGDPCMGVAPEDRCGTAGTTCDGDTLTTCAENATGCLVTTEADCSADGGTCDDSGAMAMCSSDPCMGVTNCDMEARSCDGDTLTVCALDAMGCLVTSDTDCAGDGTVCDDGGAMAMCVDACDGVSDCDTEGRSCDGDTLNVCAPDAAGCLVNTPTECAGEGAMCDDAVDPIACVPTSCPPATAFAMALDCDSGTVSGNTMGGTSDLNVNCGFTGYSSPENVFTFEDARSATVTITATRTAGTGDADILVLEGGAAGVNACGEASCLDTSRGTGDEEEVEFDLVAGDVAYVAYDVWSTGAINTVEYDLTVACTFSTCGDSNIEGAEQCDDGNSDDSDGCSALCQVEPGYDCTEDAAGLSTCVFTCGNSVVDGADACDDGNADAADGCSDFCEIEDGYICEEDAAGLSTCTLSCGDSEVNGEDECDDGGTAAGDGCSDTCEIETGYFCEEDAAGLSTCELSCGDGVINGEDECDDMNDTDADGCTACVVDMGYSCSGAPSVCALTCGDGDFDAALGEFCDDGNADNGDGCAMDCTIEADFACANDDGETSICTSTGMSIDGVLEDTDTAWTRPGSTCTAGSTDTVFELVEYTNTTGAEQTVDILVNYAYDGYVHVFTDTVDPADPTTSCVVGNDDFHSTANGLIQDVIIADGATIYIAVSAFNTGRGEFSVHVTDAGFGCGNGLIDVPNDDCDDGNTMDGDGCSALCAPEDGFECDAEEPSVCTELVCGNGIIQTGEDCDDMNMANGDGCSDACEVETDFVCEGEPSMCVMPVCGNGTVEAGELCDGQAGCQADCLSAVFSGTLDGTEDLYDRNGSGCTASGGETGVHQDVETFTWNGPADATLDFTVAWTGVDGFLHAYDNPFDSTMPLVGCLDGGDDFGGTSGSQVTVDATPAQVIDIVMSTYDPADTGDWVLTVTLD